MTDIDAIVNAVWQTLLDDELKALTPPKFYEAIAGLNVPDDIAEDAWFAFRDRQKAVFA